MVTLLCAMICFLPQGEVTPLDKAKALKQDGAYLRAEGHYLDLVLTEDMITPVALDLAEIALLSGNPSGKTPFYQSLLTRSRPWRGAALLILSVIHGHEGDFPAFRNYTMQWFSEFNQPHPVRYNLLYYLARFTPQQAAGLHLKEHELAWFHAARNLPTDARFPKIDHADAPYYLAQLHLLGATEPFSIPSPPQDAQPVDRYFAKLLAIHDALLRDDLTKAALGLNETIQEGKKLGRMDLHLLLTELMLRFFERREQSANAQQTRNNLARQLDWTVLPLVSLPEAQKAARIKDTQPETGPEDAETKPEALEETPELILPSDDEPATVESTPNAFQALETRLLRREKGLEFKIKALSSPTTYLKIYKNYLMGLHYLNSGLNNRAQEHLNLAKTWIKDLPFPLLETGVLMAMARYYDAMGNAEKAEWYRIHAVQIWNAPENLPVFSQHLGADTLSPHQALIDQALMQATKEDVVGRLLYYSELDHFVRQRRHAYRRGVLARNPIINNQMKQLGAQLYGMVDNLAQTPDSSATPERFNQVLDIWNTSWQQSQPWYLDTTMPSLQEVQNLLKRREQLIVFIEGNTNLGVLLLSVDQAFALDLGSKSRFLALSESDRLGFLSNRLGPIWDRDGLVYLQLPHALRQAGMIETFRARMNRAERLRLILSLKNFAGVRKVSSQCDAGLILSAGFMPNLGEARNTVRWDLSVLRGLDPDDLTGALGDHGHLLYAGPLELEEGGLRLGPPNLDFFFHQIVLYNASLCSLTLVATQPVAWGPLLDELALIDPGTRFAITLIDQPAKLGTTDILSNKLGLMLP